MENTVTQMQKRYVTAQELGGMIGVSEDVIWRWARDGRIPSVRIGRRLFFVADKVFAALEG